MPRRKRIPLPAAGDAFAVPLEDGRYSACRVLADKANRPSLSIHAVLVAGSAWIGTGLPKADDHAVRQILRLTHHRFENKPLVYWVDEQVPDAFTFIGKIEPTEDEIRINCPTHAAWINLQQQPLLQWQWEHEHDQVERRDAERNAAYAERASRLSRKREAYLSQVTLEGLQKRRFFRTWTQLPTEVTKEARRTMKETVRKLSELEAPGEKARLRILKECIDAFNELDRRYEFIDTVERDHICSEFEAIFHAAGLGKHKQLADRWRDW